MDVLPELPFEQVLSYLSLEDRLKSRAVSRDWCQKIDSFRVKGLCCSSRPYGFIIEKRRFVRGAFAQNFINSPRIEVFFRTFRQSILSNLKHLRLCELRIENGAAFSETLNSFGRLEELDLFYCNYMHDESKPEVVLNLNLPRLRSARLEYLDGIKKLTLDAPNLQKLKLYFIRWRTMDLVHFESVETLMSEPMGLVSVEKFKNLKYLYTHSWGRLSSTFLARLEQLRELYLIDTKKVSELFEQKRRYGRVDLKIYLQGILLDGLPDLSGVSANDKEFNDYCKETVAFLAKSQPGHPRVVDELPLWKGICSNAIEAVAPGLEVNFLNRFIDLSRVILERPVQDVRRLLDVLKHFEHIVEFSFLHYQPQELFDRLPELCALQLLSIYDCAVSDLQFLFRLKHLVQFHFGLSIDAETIRKVFEKLPFLSRVSFYYLQNSSHKPVAIRIYPDKIEVSADGKQSFVPDLNAAIQLIIQ